MDRDLSFLPFATPGAAILYALRSGGRAALRLIVPAAAALSAVLVYFGPDLWRALGQGLFPSERGVLGPSVLVIVALVTFAGFLLPRVELETPFLGALPTTRRSLARASLIALAAAQSPAISFFLLVLLGATTSTRALEGLATTALGLLLAPFSTAVAVRAWAQARWPARACALFALGSGVLLVAGRWLELACGAALLAAAERGALGRLRERSPLRRRRGFRGEGWLAFPAQVALRCVGWRVVVSSSLGALLPIGAVMFFVHNNALPVRATNGAWTLGTAMALGLVVSDLAWALRVRRSLWLFERSLPRAAARRVLDDSVLLCVAGVVLLAGVALVAGGRIALLLPLALYAAVRGAAVARVLEERFMGAARLVLLLEICAWGAAMALSWWALGFLALAVAPAWLAAAGAESRGTSAGAIARAGSMPA